MCLVNNPLITAQGEKGLLYEAVVNKKGYDVATNVERERAPKQTVGVDTKQTSRKNSEATLY